MGIKYIIQLCNTILRKGSFPPQWKVAQIIIIQKRKFAELAESQETSILKDLHNNGEPKADSRSSI